MHHEANPPRITILSAETRELKSCTTQVFSLLVDETPHVLRYSVEPEYGFLFDDSRCDGVLVTLLIHAIRGNYNIECRIPVSRKLLFSLRTQVIPQLALCSGKRAIEIESSSVDDINGGDWIATGISCGVDSLSALYENTELSTENSDRVTHCVYFKVGAHDGQLGKFDADVENSLYRKQLATAEHFCSVNGFPLITVDTNVLKMTSNAFGFSNYDISWVYRNAGTMLVLQKGFKRYYVASSYNLDAFKIDLDRDSGYYSKWLLPNLSTEQLSIFEANGGLNRVQKTLEISSWKPSYDSLLVCWTGETNCGTCAKCIRTLAALDLCGALDKYANSFDIDQYRNHREEYARRIIGNRIKDPYFMELYEFARKQGRSDWLALGKTPEIATPETAGISPKQSPKNPLASFCKRVFKRVRRKTGA